MNTKFINTENIVNALEYCKQSSICSECRYCTIFEDAAEAIKALKKIVESSGTDPLSLRNCVNCDHWKVCATVEKRKLAKANDYTPCEHWKQIEE